MIKSFDIFLILLSITIFLFGLYKRTRLWGIGRKDKQTTGLWRRFKVYVIDGIAHKRILQDIYPGLLHLLIFIGFVIPLLVIFVAQWEFTFPSVIAQLISLILDLIALTALIALSLIFYRRYIKRPPRLDNRPEDLKALLLLLFVFLTGLILEGLKLSIIEPRIFIWAPVGKAIASLFDAAGLNQATQNLLSIIIFRIHFFLVLFVIAYIPYSKLFHIISSSMNMIYRSIDPKGLLSHIDLEDENAESFGVSKIEEFTWKQLLDLDACIRCGRCEDHCPAHLTEKPLSPKKMINDLKEHFHQRASNILLTRVRESTADNEFPLVEKAIEKNTLWACTTCRSCMDHCPVYVEHVDKIVDMRRHQVLMESQFPEELMTAFKGLERNSNPWGLGSDARSDWIEELNVPILSERDEKDIEYLFYVGCIRSYDDRNKKVATAMSNILNHLGVKYAILGMEEGCCGDPARRVGNEYLYQILAQTNIEVFKRYGIKKILTTCPHCYNTLKNEYGQLGFKAEVIHHTTFIQEQLQNRSLKLKNPLPKTLTYHDPCYLGRYNGIFIPPRKILSSIPSLDVREMKRSLVDSFCCGAGGGWMWMDEKIGKRINITRLEDAITTNSEWIATACPFCVTMFNDAIKDKNLEEKMKVWDIAELVEQAAFGVQ